MNYLIFTIILPIVYLIPFEIMTYAIHKHIMHGFGWAWHESHHANPGGGLEKNDLYSLVFACISIALFYLATRVWHSWWLLSLAIGLTLYGACYYFIHDIVIHRRIPNQLFRRIKHPYIKSLIRAHAIHHKNQARDNSEAFGFLYAPKTYRFPTHTGLQQPLRHSTDSQSS